MRAHNRSRTYTHAHTHTLTHLHRLERTRKFTWGQTAPNDRPNRMSQRPGANSGELLSASVQTFTSHSLGTHTNSHTHTHAACRTSHAAHKYYSHKHHPSTCLPLTAWRACLRACVRVCNPAARTYANNVNNTTAPHHQTAPSHPPTIHKPSPRARTHAAPHKKPYVPAAQPKHQIYYAHGAYVSVRGCARVCMPHVCGPLLCATVSTHKTCHYNTPAAAGAARPAVCVCAAGAFAWVRPHRTAAACVRAGKQNTACARVCLRTVALAEATK